MSRRSVTVALVCAFVIVPLAELAVVIRVGSLIGIVPTIVLLLLESMLGAWLVRREGARTWRALRAALTQARLPDRELADSALVLVGGTLLLTPGFLTDLAGFFMILPPTRPLARRWLLRLVSRRIATGSLGLLRGAGGGFRARTPRRPPSGSDDGRRVIRGDIVDDDSAP